MPKLTKIPEFKMHISGEVAKTLATLTPLTNLLQNDAYYSTYLGQEEAGGALQEGVCQDQEGKGASHHAVESEEEET